MERRPTDAPPAVLIVEDNPGDAELLSEYLSDLPGEPADVTHVRTLKHAVDYLSTHKVDNVFLDLGLTDSVGLATLKHVADAAPQTPIVVISGTDDSDTRDEALKGEADGFFVKGHFNRGQLFHALRALRRRRQVASPSSALSINVVVADDDPDSARAVSLMLRVHGYDLVTRVPPAEAGDRLRADQPDVAIVGLGDGDQLRVPDAIDTLPVPLILLVPTKGHVASDITMRPTVCVLPKPPANEALLRAVELALWQPAQPFAQMGVEWLPSL